MTANLGAGYLALYLLDIVVADLTPPFVTNVTRLPAEGETTDMLLASFSVSFSKDLDPATVNADNPFTRRIGDTYYFVTNNQMTWTDANEYALSIGGQLLSIHSEEEQQFLQHWFSRFVAQTPINIPPALVLTISPERIAENSPTPASGTVRHNTTTENAVEVSLAGNVPDRLAVPETVTIPPGRNFVNFPLTPVNNSIADGNVEVEVTAGAEGFIGTAAVITVVDDCK